MFKEFHEELKVSKKCFDKNYLVQRKSIVNCKLFSWITQFRTHRSIYLNGICKKETIDLWDIFAWILWNLYERCFYVHVVLVFHAMSFTYYPYSPCFNFISHYFKLYQRNYNKRRLIIMLMKFQNVLRNSRNIFVKSSYKYFRMPNRTLIMVNSICCTKYPNVRCIFYALFSFFVFFYPRDAQKSPQWRK